MRHTPTVPTPCENGCGRSHPKDTEHMTLVVTADGAFVELCDPCHRAYRAGYDAAQELARLEKRNAAIGGPIRRRAT